MAWTWQYQGHVEPLIQFGAAPPAPALDGWVAPICQPVPPARRTYEGASVTVWEPTLTQQPPALSWWQPASSPVLPARRNPYLPASAAPDWSTLPVASVPTLDGWGQPLAAPLRGPPRLRQLPQTFGANPADFPAIIPAPPLDGWAQPTARPVLPARRSAWLPEVLGANPADFPAGSPAPPLSWWQPLARPVLPARRAYAGTSREILEPSLYTAPPPPDAWLRPIVQPALPARRNPTLPTSQPPDPAVLDLIFNPDDGYWTMPLSQPVVQPQRKLLGWLAEAHVRLSDRPPLEDTAISRPVLPRRRTLEGCLVGSLEPSLTQTPPPLSWGQPVAQPVLPPKRSAWLPASAAPDPAAVIDGAGVPDLDGWAQPTARPVPPARRTFAGWLVTTYEPSLTQSPPGLSWWMPLSAPVLPARRSAWLPAAIAADPATVPGVDPTPLASWVQPISQPVLLPRRLRDGIAATTWEPTLTQPPPAMVWVQPPSQPVLQLRRNPWLPACVPTDFGTLNTVGAPPLSWWQPITQPVLQAARRLTAGFTEEPLEPTLTRLPPALSWWQPTCQPVLPARRGVWLPCHVAPSADPTAIVQACAWVQPTARPVLPARRSMPRHTLTYLDPPVVVAPGTPRPIALLANHQGATFSLLGSAAMSISTAIAFFRGEDVILNFQMSPVVDITTWVINWDMADDLGDSPTVQKVATITDGPNGKFAVTILSADTANLPVGGYVWDARRETPGSKVTVADGSIHLKQEVTP